MIAERYDRIRLLARVAPLFAAVYAILWFVSLDLSHAIPRDGTTLVVGRDFLNTWVVGQIAWGPHPERFYDLATYQAEVAKWVGPGYLGQVWSYPPSVMLVGAPLSRLPYLAALVLWTVIGPAAFFLALRSWTKDPYLIVAAMLCPAAIFGVISGQFAYLAAALILTVLRWRQARPWLAGLLLGLLTLKPQLGLFFPIMLLAARDWRVIGGAVVSAAGIAGITILIWGIAPWSAYLTEGIATQSRVLSDPETIAAPFMPTLFVNLRSAGVPVDPASWVQAAMSAIAAGVIIWRFRTRPSADDVNANALFLAAAASGSAYLMAYDTLAMTTAILLSSLAGGVGRWLTFGIYFLVLIQIVLGSLGIPGAALLPIIAMFTLAKRGPGQLTD